MLIYIAAPLFNEAEKDFNLRVDAALRDLGADTYLPQRDAGEAARLIAAGGDKHHVCSTIYQADCDAVAACDVLLMVLDGRVPDEGACVELGMAVALNKLCVGLQTDSRRFGGTDNNLMIDYSLTWIASSLPDLTERLAKVLSSSATSSPEADPRD